MDKHSFQAWVPSACIEVWKEAVAELAKCESETTQFIKNEQEQGRIRNNLNPLTLAKAWVKDGSEFAMERALYRFLTYENMRLAFAALDRKNVSAAHTIRLCRVGLIGPTGSETKTPAERAAWLAKVKETALQLAELVELSDLDNVLVRNYQAAHAAALVFHSMADGLSGNKNAGSRSYKMFFPKPANLSGFLRKFAEEADVTAGGDLVMDRPRDKDARRAYFVRSLTKFFRDECGMPLRAVVATFTSTAFDCEISERAIIRLAP